VPERPTPTTNGAGVGSRRDESRGIFMEAVADGRSSYTPTRYIAAMEATAADVGYVENRDAILKRLARIEGQVRGLGRMVADDAYCIDVLTQLAAVSKALDGVGFEVLSDHTRHCVRNAVERGGDDAEEKIAELLAAVERFSRA
jgi:DNA-binding FrmR family transcriptional regulator